MGVAKHATNVALCRQAGCYSDLLAEFLSQLGFLQEGIWHEGSSAYGHIPDHSVASLLL